MPVGGDVSDEQRVAAGVGDDRVGVVGINADERGDIVAVETTHLEAGDGGGTLQIGEQRDQVLVEIGGGVPRRGHDEQPRPTGRADEVADDVSGRGRRPVQVLDHKQGRSRRREARQPVADPVDHSRGCLQVVRSWCGRPGGAGEHGQHLDGHADRPALDRIGNDLGKRTVRLLHVLVASTEQHPPTGGVHLGRQLGDEAALPHPRLGGHDHEQRVPGHRELPSIAQALTFGAPADETGGIGQQLERRWQQGRGRRSSWCRPSAGAPDQVAPVGRVELAEQ